jgi:hypothetical protein
MHRSVEKRRTQGRNKIQEKTKEKERRKVEEYGQGENMAENGENKT